jgi:hypothetical protein
MRGKGVEYRLERQSEMRVLSNMQDDLIGELGLAFLHLVLYFKNSEIYLNFGSMLILMG